MADDNDNGGSVRDELEAAFAKAAEKEGGSQDTVDTGADDKVTEPAKEAVEKGVDDAKKPVESDDSVEKKAAKEPAKSDEDDDTKVPEPPARWTPEEKQAWYDMIADGMEPEAVKSVVKAQKILLNRNKSMESWFTKEMQSISADRNWKKNLDDAIAPHRQTWSAAGLSDAEAIKQLLDGFAYSNRDPIGFIQWIAEQRGVDLHAAFGGGHDQQLYYDDDGSPVELHPLVKQHIDAQSQQINQLSSQLQALTGQWHNTQQASEQQLHQSVSQEIQAFESATNTDGSPKHPFFNDVRQDMQALLQSGLANTLEDAYDRATYARPDIRSKMLENHELKLKRDMEKRMAEEARKARAAGGGLSGGAPTAPVDSEAPPADGSIRATLEAAVRAQMGGGRI